MIAAIAAITLSVSCKRHQSTPVASPVQPTAVPYVAKSEVVSTDTRLAPARDALDQNDYVTALKACSLAQKEGAPPAEVLATQAQIFRGTQYLDKELETLKKWEQIAPKDFRPTLRLFYLYFDLGWRHEAAKASDHLIKLAPHEARCLEARAILHYRSNEPYRGMKYIEEARKLDPDNPNLANLQATMLIKVRRAAEAETELRKSIARYTGRPSDRLLLIQAMLAQHKTKDLEPYLQDMLKQEPDNIEVQYQLGAFQERRGNLKEAGRLFEQVAQRNPQYAKTLWFLGRIYMQTGRASEGRKILKTFQEMDANYKAFITTMLRLEAWPGDPNLHYRLAQFHLAADDELPKAIVELRKVLQLRPGDQLAKGELVAALARHGRMTESRQLQQTAMAPGR